MTLRESVLLANQLLTKAGIDHAMIGGLALASYGAHRATKDVDLLIDASQATKVRELFTTTGFKISHESEEVLQFTGPGNIDFLLARRPMSLEMLKRAKILPPFEIKCVDLEDIIGLKIQAYCNNPSREFQDKADIVSLLKSSKKIDWKRIQVYAELFDQWAEIQRMRTLTE